MDNTKGINDWFFRFSHHVAIHDESRKWKDVAREFIPNREIFHYKKEEIIYIWYFYLKYSIQFFLYLIYIIFDYSKFCRREREYAVKLYDVKSKANASSYDAPRVASSRDEARNWSQSQWGQVVLFGSLQTQRWWNSL